MRKAVLALIIANIIWGAASPIFKLSLQNIPPFTLAFWRFFLGTLFVATFLRGRISFTIDNRRNFLLFLTNACMGITGNIIFFFLGLQLTYAINAPIIASGGPVFVFFLAVLFLRERFSVKKLFGMLLGTAGMIVIVIEPIVTRGIDGSLTGNLYLVLATICAVLATLAGRSVFSKYNPLPLTFWAFLVGTVSFLPLAVFELIKQPTIYSALDWRGFLGIGFGSLLSSAVAYTLFNWGLSKISATDTSVFSYIDPIIGTILAHFILHEPITAPFLAGSALIFGGIGIAEGRLHYHPLHRLRVLPKHTVEPEGISSKHAQKKDIIRHIFKRNATEDSLP